MFFVWYLYDDTMARVLGVPGLGDIPLWIPVMLCVISIADKVAAAMIRGSAV